MKDYVFLWSVVRFIRFEIYFCNGLICKRFYEKHLPGVFSSDFVTVSTPFNASFVALLFWWFSFFSASVAKWESWKKIGWINDYWNIMKMILKVLYQHIFLKHHWKINLLVGHNVIILLSINNLAQEIILKSWWRIYL